MTSPHAPQSTWTQNFVSTAVAFCLLGLAIPARAQETELATLYPRSYGVIKFGEKLATLEELLGEKLVADDLVDEACYFGHFPRYPSISFMIEEGTLVRGDISETGITTAGGLSVGSTAGSVKGKFPEIEITDHAYSNTGHYMTNKWDSGFGLVFEEDEGLVTGVRAGTIDAIEMVEGCY